MSIVRNIRIGAAVASLSFVVFATMAGTTQPSSRPISTPGGGSTAPHVSFLGVDDSATKLVFLCDASETMQPKSPVLRGQLGLAISALTPSQSFDIVYMQRGAPKVLSPSLQPATEVNKKGVADFGRDTAADPETDPLPSLDAAFAAGPDLIYLVVDGDFPDNAAVTTRIRDLNKDKKVRIDTIAFRDAADKDTEFFALLRQIALQNGGKFAAVKVSDFIPR